MKAFLKLVNIGQRIGEEKWTFNSGRVTEIRGRTASGKSRILKSCALALSLPITSEDIKKDAIGFGIAKAPNESQSPLLNSNKDKALIELQYGEDSKIVELNKDGTETINEPGNQNFLYCGMLFENSKIHNNIDQGIPDFSWIVTEMSLAKYYEAIKEIVGAYAEKIISVEEEINKNESKIKEFTQKKEENQINLDKINKQIEKLTNEIEAIKIDPRLEDDYDTLIIEIKEKNKILRDRKNDLGEKKKELSATEKKINSNIGDIESITKKLGEKRRELTRLKDIDPNEIFEEIDSLRIENEKLYEEQEILNKKLSNLQEKSNKNLSTNLDELNKKYINKLGSLKEELGRIRGKKKEYEETLQKLEKDNLNEALCWICGKGTVKKDEIEGELEILREEEKKTLIEEKEIEERRISEKNALEEKIKNEKKVVEDKILNEKAQVEEDLAFNDKEIIKKQKERKDLEEIEVLDEDIGKLNKDYSSLKQNKDDLEKKKGLLDGQLPQLEEQVKLLEALIDQKEKEKEKINDEMIKNKEAAPKVKKRSKLTKESGNVEGVISDLDFKITKASNIELLDFEFNLLEGKKIITDLKDLIDQISVHINTNIKEQLEGAAIKFNDNIEKIIRELNFSEFKEISLDLENYNLNIIRTDETKQPLNSLSGGEKVVISSLLQISAKETYNPEIPFIVGDDIILKMDDNRREVFYNYLKEIAKNNDWFIILTRVTDEDLIKEEI